MQITIRNYEQKDEEQLKQLINLGYEEDHLLNIVNTHNVKLALSAFAENKLVGSLIVWTNKFHPYCTYFRILSDPFYFEHNVAEKLLSKLDELKEWKYPLQTSIWETSANLRILFETNGFKEIRRTYMPILLTSNIEDYLPQGNDNLRVKSLHEIVSNEILIEKLTQLVKRNYQQAHLMNPVVERELSVWKGLILSEDVDLIGSYVCLNNEESDIVAYSLLHTTEEIDSMELGWCGVNGHQSIDLVPQLIKKQINYAVKHNFKSLVGEFDTTDFYAMEVLRRFPFAPSPTWITYQR